MGRQKSIRFVWAPDKSVCDDDFKFETGAMTSLISAEKMIGENDQKKCLVFNLFKFRSGGDYPPVISIITR